MKGDLPVVAHSLEIDHCSAGHVVVTMKDARGNDVALAHLDLNAAIEAVAGMQRVLIHIEEHDHQAIAGHA